MSADKHLSRKLHILFYYLPLLARQPKPHNFLISQFLQFLLLLATLPTFAQSELEFVRYSTADGLPGNRVGHVCADPEGFVWAATSEGLARFDGQRFVVIEGLLPDIRSQYANRVRLMFPDDRGFLWVLVFGEGVWQIDLHTLKTRAFQQDFLKIGGGMFPAACQDDKGNLWLTANGGLACFRQDKQDFEFHPFPNPKVWVSTFCKMADGKLLVSTSDGLYEFDVSDFKWNLNLKLWSKGDHLSLIGDADGTVWIGDWYQKRGGFRHYDPKRKQNLRLFSAMPSHPDSIPSTDFQGFFADGDRIWLATNDQGLVMFDKKTERFRRYQPSADQPRSFSAMQSFSAMKDKFGNLWVGTAQFLNFARIQPKIISHVGYKDGLISNECLIATAVSPEKMVFGTLSGLSIYDRRQRSFRNVSLPLFNKNSYNNQVIAAAPCDATSFWVNTWSSLSRIDLNTGKVLEYFITNVNAGQDHPPALMRTDIGTSLFIKSDPAGNLWMAANGRLVKFSHSGAPRGFSVAEPLAKEKIIVNCFWLENERQLLFGAYGGIGRFDAVSGKIEKLPFRFPFDKTPVVIDFLEKSSVGGYLVIANRRLFRLDPEHPAKAPVEIKIPFPNFSPNGMVEDEEGGIWVSSELGVVRLSPDGKTSTLFEPKHHLNNNFFSPDKMHIAKDAEGMLYFPGSAGVSVVQPGAILGSDPPTVRIVSFMVNNEPFPLENAIYHTRQIRLAHDENNLHFGFSVFNSSVPELNRFSYQLEGVSPNWVTLNTQNSLNLSKLAPGTYVLRLRGANSDGVWAEAAEPLRIVIRPPWYASWWAYLLYASALAAAGWLYYRFRLRQKLAEQEAQRLQELDEFKSRFFTNITHEFRTPLTVILGMTEKWAADGERQTAGETKNAMGLIKRNGENLLRLINQILDLAKLESNSLKINYVQGDVLPYLRYISESLHSFANAQNVMLRVESKEAEIVMDYDPERLLSVVHNLLSNAIKFTPSGGRVTLRAGLLNLQGLANLDLQVSDTGPGILPGDLPQIFDRFYQADNQAPPLGGRGATGGTGIGLSLTKELVKAMGGNIAVESRTSPLGDRGAGTTFTVRLPITQNAPVGASDSYQSAGTPAPTVAPGTEFGRPQGASENGEHPTILIIEDNPDVVEYLAACLNGGGLGNPPYALDFAYNGRAGIEKALEAVPDLIISDVMMPEKDGFEVCDFLKNDERTSHIPIVLLTAKADMESRIAGLKRGADAYLAKPFHPEELMVTLENLLDLRRKLQEKFRNWEIGKLDIEVQPAEPPLIPHPASLEDAFLKKLHLAVEPHLGDADLSLEKICRAVGMGKSNLYAKLSALTGLSFNIYVRKLRLVKARELLQVGQMNVSEVAYEVGFNDPKFFSRVFSEEYGVPPSEVQKAKT